MSHQVLGLEMVSGAGPADLGLLLLLLVVLLLLLLLLLLFMGQPDRLLRRLLGDLGKVGGMDDVGMTVT